MSSNIDYDLTLDALRALGYLSQNPLTPKYHDGPGIVDQTDTKQLMRFAVEMKPDLDSSRGKKNLLRLCALHADVMTEIVAVIVGLLEQETAERAVLEYLIAENTKQYLAWSHTIYETSVNTIASVLFDLHQGGHRPQTYAEICAYFKEREALDADLPNQASDTRTQELC